MNGYFVSITNNLLEDKHFERMGNAVWLYMWLIDKMTEISEGQGIVNFGNPITYEQVQQNFNTISIRTYRRMIDTLREAGYINTLRTPHGLYITINKPKKQFNKKADSTPVKKRSAKSGTSLKKPVKGSANPDTSDVPKLSERSAKSGTSIYIDNTNTINNTDLHTTNVVGDESPPVRYGKPEINDLFDYWESKVGYKIEARVTANRRAASTLLKKYGAERLKRLIDGANMAQSDRYAPRISDFSSLQSKANDLIAWGKTRHNTELQVKPLRFGSKK